MYSRRVDVQRVVLALTLAALAQLALAWPPANRSGTVAANVLARNVYVIFDGSGSMRERSCTSSLSKNAESKQALETFARSVPKAANLGLAVFDGGGLRELIPLGTNNRDAFIRAVQAVNPGGGTPLARAVTLGRQRLEDQAAKQLGYGEYNLVVVTDGEANEGQDPRSAVNDMLLSTPIVLHTIGFCIGTGHSLNQRGRTVYRAANSERELRAGLEEVLAESPAFTVQRFDRH